jgi:glycosyltransferase involved in cell wall biosynthesis
MRIGFDASVASGQPGGTGTYAVQLLNALIVQRPDWTFFLYFRRVDQPNPLLTIPAGNPNVHRVTVPGTPNTWRVQVALPRRLRHDGIDVYHSPGPFLPLRWPGPKVVTIHDLNIYLNVRNWLRPKTLLAWADLALETPFSARVARRVITASEGARADLQRLLRVHRDAIRVIPDAPDPFFDVAPSPEERAAVREIASDKPYVLFVGVLSPQKNLRRLLLAFARSSLPAEGINLVLAGRDESDYGAVLRRLAGRFKIDSLLKLPGYVPRSTLRGLYAGALCLVLPSHGEGFGLPVVEAMALGAPILAANRQAIPEVVGEGGLLFDPTNLDELATLLNRVWLDGPLREDLSERARLRRKDFSWEKTAALTADVYLEAAGG